MSEKGEQLLATIGREFNDRLKTDRKLLKLAGKIPKSASYERAGEYAERVGELLGETITGALKGETVTEELAAEVLPPVLEYGHALATEAAAAVQTNLNAEAGLGIGSLQAATDPEQTAAVIDQAVQLGAGSDGSRALKESVTTYARNAVDRTLEKNAKASAKIGVKRYIERKAEAPGTVRGIKTVYSKKGKAYRYPYAKYSCYEIPCEWCAKLAGRYEYTGTGRNVPDEVYQRHRGCRCTLTFENGKERQNVWDHAQKWSADDADGQRKAYEQITRQREAEQQRKAQDAANRTAEIEWLMNKTGMSAKNAAIWRNMRLSAIQKAGGIEKYWQQGGL